MSESRKLEAEELLLHAGWVRSLAARLARDHAEADDLTQDTLAAALQSPPRAGREARSWLGRVLGNVLRNRRREERRRGDREALAADWSRNEQEAGDAELLTQLERQQQLAHLVGELTEPYRSVVLARYYRGESAARIARRTGVPSGTVRSQLARGLTLLRQRLVAHEGGDRRAARAVLLAAAVGPDKLGLTLTALSLTKGILALKTSTKIVAAGAAALALLGSFAGFQALARRSDAPEDPLRTAQAAAPLASEEASVPVPAAETEAVEDPDEARIEVPPSTKNEVEGLTLPEGAALLTARVVDEAGMPLAGAVLRYVDERRPLHHCASEPADADGRVRLELVPEALLYWSGGGVANVSLSAEAENHALRFMLVTPVPNEVTELGEVVLGPGGQVSGIVLDEHGQPARGARIYVAGVQLGTDPGNARLAGPPRDLDIPSDALQLPAAASGADGRFLVPFVATGPARLWARLDDGPWVFGEAVEVFPASETSGQRLVLQPLQKSDLITGRVVDPTGVAVAQAQVYYSTVDPFRYGQKVSTDAEGNFRIRPESRAPHMLSATDGQNRWQVCIREGVLVGSEVELRLGEAQWVEVTIVDTDGRPVPEARLSVETRAFTGHLVRQVEERDEGVFAFVVSEGHFGLSIYAKGFTDERMYGLEASTIAESLTVELERQPIVAGWVLANGEPVAGAEVKVCEVFKGYAVKTEGFLMHYDMQMSPASVTTDDEGWFEAPGRARPDFQSIVAVQAEGWALAEWGPFALDELAGDIEIELTPGGDVEGELLFPEGRDPRGQLVAATRGDGNVLTVRTDEKGVYRLERLTPGPWRIEHRKQEMEKAWQHMRAGEFEPVDWNCQVIEGATVRHDIDMTAPAKGVLRGRLTIDGVPAQGWTATLERPEDAHVRRDERGMLLDAEGRFELRDEVARGYHLVLRTPPEAGEAAIEIDALIALGGEELEWTRDLELGTLGGSIADSGVLRLRSEEDGVSVTTIFETSAHGSFHGAVPAGTGVLQLRRYVPERLSTWKDLREVEIVGGATVEVELD